MRIALLAACTLALPNVAAAQLVYDAGTAGNPPTAQSPTVQGWIEALSGTVAVTDVSPDPQQPLNAWQINDTGPGEGTYAYDTFFASGWEASLTLRMLGGSIFIVIDTGDLLTNSLYEIELETVGNDVLLHRPNQPPVLCAGGAAGSYHTYRFTIANETSLFWYDDEVYGWIDETDLGLVEYGQGLRWGTGNGAGRARFHRVSLTPADSQFLSGGLLCLPAVPNSTGGAGSIRMVGSRVVADDDLTLVARSLPPGPNIGYFIMGTGTNTFTPPGSAGPICVAPGIKRFLPPVNNTTQLQGGFARTVGTMGPVSSSITPGSTWSFQAWHRDGMNPSNLTYARTIVFQ